MNDLSLSGSCAERLAAVLMSVYSADDPEDFVVAVEAITIGQTFPPDLLLVVVDGPITEPLNNAIEHLTNKLGSMIDVLRLEHNGGLSRALRHGVNELQPHFKYIIRTDADDISTSNRCREQIDFMESNLNVGVSSSQVVIFEDEKSNVVGSRSVPVEKDLSKWGLWRTPINHSASIFRSSALREINFPETRLPFEDWWISLRLINDGWMIGVIDRIHLHFRGGSEMLDRRRGLKYALGEIRFLFTIWRERLISFRVFVGNVVLRFIARILPRSLITTAYKRFLHR